MNEKYFNVATRYTSEDKNKAIEALHCYVTQYTPEEFKEESERKFKDTANIIYFRRFIVMKGLKNDFD